MKRLLLITLFALPLHAMEPEQAPQDALNQRLYNAVVKNLSDEVKTSLALGADVNAYEQDKLVHKEYPTPLWTAVLYDYPEICKLLLDHGANVNTRWKGKSALFLATSLRKMEICKLLLEHNARVNEPIDTGCTPLLDAMRNDDKALCELLLAYGANIGIKDPNGHTVLHGVSILREAATEEDQEFCKTLISHARIYPLPKPSPSRMKQAQQLTRARIWALKLMCPTLQKDIIGNILLCNRAVWHDARYTPLKLHAGKYDRVLKLPFSIIRTLIHSNALKLEKVVALLKEHKLKKLIPVMAEAAVGTSEKIQQLLNHEFLEQNFGKEIEEVIIADCLKK